MASLVLDDEQSDQPALEEEDEISQSEELEVLEHVTNKGNRVVLFDAWHWHKAEAVARICHDMRYTITYKLIANGGNNERLDFYNG